MSLRLTEREAKVLFERLNKVAPAHHIATGADLFGGVRPDSPTEAIFEQQLTALKMPQWSRNMRFCRPRKFELDFAWPMRGDGVQAKLAVEIQGGPHTIRARWQADMEKIFLEHLNGWRVIRATPADVRSGRAAAWLLALMELFTIHRDLTGGKQ